MTVARRSRLLRAGAGFSALVAGILWVTALGASSATTVAPDKTAWYDNLGLQAYTGETTPSLASNGQLEVAYVPVGVSVPQETVPSVPVTPPTLPPAAPVQIPVPDVGSVGGMTLGDTLAFAAVEYTVPLQSGGQNIDPTSLRAVLTLPLDPQTSIGVGSGDVLACPTSNALWAAGADQPASQSSSYDCSPGEAVSGNYDSSAHTLTFDLSSAQEYNGPSGPTGIFSVVLAPGSSPTGPFTAVFEPPSATSFVLTQESPELGLGDEGSAAASGTSSGFGSTSAFVGGAAGLPTSGADDFTIPTPAGSATAGAVATPTTTAPAAQARSAPATDTVAPGLSSGSQRAIAVILLVALAAGLWMAASSTRHEPRSLRQIHGAPERA